jgi:hypothetical protein
VRRHAALALKTLTAEVTLARAYVGRAKGLVGGEELEALAQGLVDVLEADKEFTPAMLALASMFMLQDQVARKCNTHTRATPSSNSHPSFLCLFALPSSKGPEGAEHA